MLSLADYLSHKNWYRKLHRGLTVYACPSDFHEWYFQALSRLDIELDYIVLSRFNNSSNGWNCNLSANEIIIVNDLSPAGFLSMADRLFGQVIMPAFRKKITLTFLCPYNPEQWQIPMPSAEMLHQNGELLLKHLYAEDIVTLIQKINFQITPAPSKPYENTSLTMNTAIAEHLFSRSSRLDQAYECPADYVLSNGQNIYPVVLYNLFPEQCDDNLPHTWISQFDLYPEWSLHPKEIPKIKLDPLILNDPLQQRAVFHVNGPIRVLAPAGAGKTKVLINRILHLIRIGIRPERILALAFNTKAAEEMRMRLQSQNVAIASQLNEPGVVIRTFHSLGYELLREYTGQRFTEGTDHSLRQILKHSVDHYQPVRLRRNEDAYRPFMDMIRRYKTEIPSHAEYLQSPEKKNYPDIFQHFLKCQQEQGLCNYDDMLYLTLRELLNDPVKRQAIGMRFEFILIDEFQDLNSAQLWLMRLLSAPRQNLFVVGDDDQMIYGWRGAHIRHILEFNREYPLAETCVLERNYRSARSIVRHSRRLIEHNRGRVLKNIHARDTAPEGWISVFLGNSLMEQAEYAAESIQRIRNQFHCAWSDIAILYRYHAYQIPVALALRHHHIPHTPVHFAQLFRTAPGLDLHAYLTILQHPEHAPTRLLRRILKRPNKFIPNLTIQSIVTWNDLVRASHSDQTKIRETLSRFVDNLKRLKWTAFSKTSDLLHQMDKDFQLQAFYRQQKKEAEESDIAGDEVIWEVIMAVAEMTPDISSFCQLVTDSLQNEHSSALTTIGAIQDDAVHLTTIHRTKGNEYPHVIYYNLSSRVTENRNTLEEERRVAYVAVTRAIQSIRITAPKKDYALFLDELLIDPALKQNSSFQVRRQLKKLLHALPSSLTETEDWKNIMRLVDQRKYSQVMEALANLSMPNNTGLLASVTSGEYETLFQLAGELAFRRQLQKANNFFGIFRKK